MLTLVETSAFNAAWPRYWNPEQFGEFCAWLALHPESGDVIPGSGGCRKVRWSAAGRGKRGGVRVIHYNRVASGRIWLLTMYAKNERTTVAPATLKTMVEMIHGESEGESESKETPEKRTQKYR